jgi:hypothetical protein
MPPNVPEESVYPKPQRLKLLGDDEIDSLYGLPRFTNEQRVEYFWLSSREQSPLMNLHERRSFTTELKTT